MKYININNINILIIWIIKTLNIKYLINVFTKISLPYLLLFIIYIEINP